MDASAAQKQPVTKTCSQCGAVLPSSVRACNFCDLSVIPETTPELSRGVGKRGAKTLDPEFARDEPDAAPGDDGTWRGELAERLAAYRVRRRKVAPHAVQSELPFARAVEPPIRSSTAVAEAASRIEDDFSFTIAIGRPSKKLIEDSGRMEIDVSLSPAAGAQHEEVPAPENSAEQSGLYPVASIEDRRLAALVDAGCLFLWRPSLPYTSSILRSSRSLEGPPRA